MVSKKTPTKAPKAKKEVKPVEQPVVEKAVAEPKAKVCEKCGSEYTSKFSGQKYCPDCSVVMAKARQKAAQKRRKQHRKDELNDLRQLKEDIIAALKGKDALAKIKALVA